MRGDIDLAIANKITSQVMSQLNNNSNYALLQLISSNHRCKYNAFDVLYNRHKDYVWRVSYYYCKNQSNPARLAEIILSETFITIFQKASYFTPREQSGDTEGFKLWITGIVKKQFLKQRELRCQEVLTDSMPEYCNSINEESTSNNPQTENLMSALQRLSPKNKDVLLLLMKFDTVRKIPSDILSYTLHKHNIKKSSLRKIKLRAIAQLKNYMNIGDVHVTS